MTPPPVFPLESRALLPGMSPAALRRMLLQQAQEHGLPVVEDSPERVTVEVPGFGHYRMAAHGSAAEAGVAAALPDRLFMLQEGLAEHLKTLQPGAAGALQWSGASAAGSLPPNVHFTTVRSVTPVGRCFLRVRVQGGDLSGFREDAIHFRLLLPPPGCAEPEWPKLGSNGAAQWPKGDKALHRPVYTTRWICHESAQMEFDIFLHDGGRAAEWARQAAAGDQLAIAGPGGGGIPRASRLLICADETALPAAARILQSLPAGSRGKATLMAAGGADCGYPVAAPEGVEVTWIRREDGGSLAARAVAERERHPGRFLWFGGEKAEAQRVRQAVKAARAEPANSYIAAYWSMS
ncbi:siderophore-interacting protein [Leisingera thetidis]|uniref:siderophore-interacting protein n=1 Tax=Leisingera thetidis TaxID=2930199 RepID=UPI0021F6BFB7|nr:siderophore-interacting protein [Leisingera thetidis]